MFLGWFQYFLDHYLFKYDYFWPLKRNPVNLKQECIPSSVVRALKQHLDLFFSLSFQLHLIAFHFYQHHTLFNSCIILWVDTSFPDNFLVSFLEKTNCHLVGLHLLQGEYKALRHLFQFDFSLSWVSYRKFPERTAPYKTHRNHNFNSSFRDFIWRGGWGPQYLPCP